MARSLSTVLRTELDNYDPVQGLKSVAVAEAAELYYTRAKDIEKLFEAVAMKLEEQRRFVVWWDQQDKAQGARGSGSNQFRKVASQTADATTIEALGLDRDTVHRWRRRLKDESKFNEAIEQAQERCRRVCEAEKGSTEQRGASGTGENEWYTPAEYLEAARDVLGGFDLDPATSAAAQKVVKATKYFTEQQNGLNQEWHGRVWLNPPYAQPAINQFVSKLVKEVTVSRVQAAILLTHNYTDTAWFHEAAAVADAICFTRGRVKFIDAKGNAAAPTQGQAFSYFGKDKQLFADRFGAIGFIVFPFHGEL